MKAFLKAYAVCLILMEVFIFFGGWMLFDLRGTGIYRAGAVIALILALVLPVFLLAGCGAQKETSAGSGASGIEKANSFRTFGK